MTALLKYDTACRAIAEAKAVDEVKDIRDRADALRVYARQAGNRKAEIDLAEIRFRAERRIGEIKRQLRADNQLHEGGRPKKGDAENLQQMQEVSKVRLIDLGVDERMSVRAEKFAEYAPDAYERLVARWRAHQEKEANRVSLNLLKEDRQAKDQADNAARFVGGCAVDDLYRLIVQGKKFNTILADPPWKFIARSDKGEGRSAGQLYRTDALETIKALPVKQLAADNCVLFMWMVDWCPKWAFEVLEAWGFVHKTTAFTWAKLIETHTGEPRFEGHISDRDFAIGQGYWTRANPEDCWLATCGNPKRLNADVRQLLVSPIMEHSRKPDEIHDRIERLVPGPYLELYARRERRGWVTWGNEIARANFENMAAADPDTGEIIETEAERGATASESQSPDDDCGTQPTTGDVTRVTESASPEAAASHAECVGPAASISPVEEPPANESRSTGNVAQPLSKSIPDDSLEIPAFLRRQSDNSFPVTVASPCETQSVGGEGTG